MARGYGDSRRRLRGARLRLRKQRPRHHSWLVLQVATRPGITAHDLGLNQPIARYGLDSLAAIELMSQIETGSRRAPAYHQLFCKPTASPNLQP